MVPDVPQPNSRQLREVRQGKAICTAGAKHYLKGDLEPCKSTLGEAIADRHWIGLHVLAKHMPNEDDGMQPDVAMVPNQC